MKNDTLPPSGYLWLIALTLGWGSAWPFLKIALTEIPPWTFRGLVAPTAVLFLLAVGYFLKVSIAPPAGQWRVLVIAALFNVTGWHVFSAFGLGTVAAGHASIIAYTMPLWAVLLSITFTAERLSARRTLGLGLGVGGLALLLAGSLGVFRASPAGTLFLLAAAASWGAGTVIQKQVKWNAPLLVVAVWQLLIGGLPVTVTAIFLELPDLQPVSQAAVWSTVYTLAIPIIFCWIAWFRIVDLVPVSVSAVSTLMIPVIAVIGGNLVLSEPIGLREVGALILVCLALVLVLAPGRQPAEGASDGGR